MPSSKDSFRYRPFEDLSRLIKKESIVNSQRRDTGRQSGSTDKKTDQKSDHQLFMEAMADVTPIENAVKISGNKHPAQNDRSVHNDRFEIRRKLADLVRSGEGFVVSQTPEYIEGVGYHAPPYLAERLHRGDFSLQDHIDLHGLDVFSAEEAFEHFFERAVREGLRTVLVIHGRGLSSPGDPVLKVKVSQWLGKSRWRKWILAYTSARSCDGGAGATYVLLREKPLSKRYRKTSFLTKI